MELEANALNMFTNVPEGVKGVYGGGQMEEFSNQFLPQGFGIPKLGLKDVDDSWVVLIGGWVGIHGFSGG